jgi:hypothetical protein
MRRFYHCTGGKQGYHAETDQINQYNSETVGLNFSLKESMLSNVQK